MNNTTFTKILAKDSFFIQSLQRTWCTTCRKELEGEDYVYWDTSLTSRPIWVYCSEFCYMIRDLRGA
jgi:hypothetical protein